MFWIMKILLLLALLICAHANAEVIYVPTFSVPAKCYDRNGYVDDCHVLFTIKDGQHYIRVTDSRYGLLTCFSQKEHGKISTSFLGNKTRWWLTGAYVVNNEIDSYQMVIFDPTNEGKVRIFYKTCPPDKSSMSESKCMYEISASDWDIVFKNFIINCTKSWAGGLEAAKTGDPFGDGVHLNGQAIK